MSFSGDLEHLSVMDVVQLMHQGRKSGTLTFKGRRGECRLGFSEGSIISVNHADNNMRIGQILVDAGAISPETLDRVLNEQERAGAERKPLIAALIEGGLVEKKTAYKSLQTLVELAIVDVLTWRGGTFSLDPELVAVSDEFRYFPEHLRQEAKFNAEYVLMDALRIYDERKNAGALAEDEGPGAAEVASELITADVLGLGDIDRLERKIPGVYLGLPDTPPAAPHGERVRDLGSDLTEAESAALTKFLEGLPPRTAAAGELPVQVVLHSADPLMVYCLSAVCEREGIAVLATDDDADLEPVIGRFLRRPGSTVLVLDAPGTGSGSEPGRMAESRRRLRAAHPGLGIVQLASPAGAGVPGLAPEDGVVAVLFRPARLGAVFNEETSRFLRSFPQHVRDHARPSGSHAGPDPAKHLAALRELRDPAETALLLLRAVAGFFPRALTLVVRGSELVAERGIGIEEGKGKQPSPVPDLRLPLDGSPALAGIVASGRCHFGPLGDQGFSQGLHGRVGPPLHPEILLLPLTVGGRTFSLIYGDFGTGETFAVSLEPWELLAGLAGMALENALLRRKLSMSAP